MTDAEIELARYKLWYEDQIKELDLDYKAKKRVIDLEYSKKILSIQN